MVVNETRGTIRLAPKAAANRSRGDRFAQQSKQRQSQAMRAHVVRSLLKICMHSEQWNRMPLHGRRPHPLLSGEALLVCIFLQRKRHMFL